MWHFLALCFVGAEGVRLHNRNLEALQQLRTEIEYLCHSDFTVNGLGTAAGVWSILPPKVKLMQGSLDPIIDIDSMAKRVRIHYTAPLLGALAVPGATSQRVRGRVLCDVLGESRTRCSSEFITLAGFRLEQMAATVKTGTKEPELKQIRIQQEPNQKVKVQVQSSGYWAANNEFTLDDVKMAYPDTRTGCVQLLWDAARGKQVTLCPVQDGTQPLALIWQVCVASNTARQLMLKVDPSACDDTEALWRTASKPAVEVLSASQPYLRTFDVRWEEFVGAVGANFFDAKPRTFLYSLRTEQNEERFREELCGPRSPAAPAACLQARTALSARLDALLRAAPYPLTAERRSALQQDARLLRKEFFNGAEPAYGDDPGRQFFDGAAM